MPSTLGCEENLVTKTDAPIRPSDSIKSGKCQVINHSHVTYLVYIDKQIIRIQNNIMQKKGG